MAKSRKRTELGSCIAVQTNQTNHLRLVLVSRLKARKHVFLLEHSGWSGTVGQTSVILRKSPNIRYPKNGGSLDVKLVWGRL